VSPVDPEAAYYQTVEEYFVSRRGDPLVLSNADWHLVRRWRSSGIPLRVVLRGVRDALDGHSVSWSRGRKVGSLAYCAREVQAAHERWARSLGGAGTATLDLAAGLRGLAGALRQARGLGPRGSAAAAGLAAELSETAGRSSLRDLEVWLAGREAALLAALRADAGAAGLRRWESAVDDALSAYAARLPARVLRQVREESLARRLLEAHGLPRLSLFHLVGGAQLPEGSSVAGAPG
jgi:hypothetical protein